MEQGKRIVVSPIPGADERKVRLFILGTCMAVIMMQRGILPLHGSAVVIDGWAYAFVGHSGQVNRRCRLHWHHADIHFSPMMLLH